jgi:hypothetical protein
MKDLTPEQWEMIWEAVQYQIGSFEYLSNARSALETGSRGNQETRTACS